MKTRHPDIEVDISFIPADAARARSLSREQVEHFNREGYVAGLRLVEPATCQAWREYFDANRARLNDYSAGFQAFHHRERELYDFVTMPRLVGWIKDLVGDDVVCHTSAYINKTPNDPTVVAWHQDCSYNPMDARSVVALVAFDDMTAANGGLWVIPRTHLLGQLEFTPTPSGLATHDAESFGRKIPVELKAGEAMIFSDQVLHMSLPNKTSDRHRRTYNATYANAALVPHLHKGDWGVLCAGQARHDHWKLHARPS